VSVWRRIVSTSGRSRTPRASGSPRGSGSPSVWAAGTQPSRGRSRAGRMSGQPSWGRGGTARRGLGV
jgi:hypothetical protein